MKALIILSLLMYSEAKPQKDLADPNNKKNDLGDSCLAAANLGVNLDGFPKHVAHNLHSITLQDIQFFFNPNFPEDNDVPTVNTDLTSDQEIVMQAPSRPSVYKFPSGAAFDFILMNNDDVDSLIEKRTSSLEKMSHAIHMQEMWYKVSMRYKKLKNAEINLDRICPCLMDQQSKEIIRKLQVIANDLREEKEVITFEFPNKEIHEYSNEEQRIGKAMGPHSRGYGTLRPAIRQGKNMASHSKGYGLSKPAIRQGKAMGPHSRGYDDDDDDYYFEEAKASHSSQNTRDGKSLRNGELIPSPDLTDSKSWEFWKKNVDAPMYDEEMEFSAALYFLCKMHQYQ